MKKRKLLIVLERRRALVWIYLFFKVQISVDFDCNLSDLNNMLQLRYLNQFESELFIRPINCLLLFSNLRTSFDYCIVEY